MKKIVFLLISIIFVSVSFAQTVQQYSLSDEIKKILSPTDLQEYNQAQDLFGQGNQLKSQADQLQAQADDIMSLINTMRRRKRRKATKKYNELHAQATQKYNDAFVKYILGYKKLYKIYDKNLPALAPKINSQNKSAFNQKLTLAHEGYKTAMDYVKKGVAAKRDQQKKYEQFKQAYDMFKLTVGYQEQAFKIYFDQIYAAKQQQIASQPQIQKRTQISQTKSQPPKQQPIIIHDQTTQPQQKTTQKRQQQPVYISDKPIMQTHQQPAQTYNQPAAKPKADLYFRVQVAASRVRLSQSKIHAIYPGRVYMEFDPSDGRYKYLTYEKFSTYESAHTFKYSCGVPGAFVVAYKNGRRVPDICQVVPCRR